MLQDQKEDEEIKWEQNLKVGKDGEFTTIRQEPNESEE